MAKIWKSDIYSRVSDDGGAPLASTALYSVADPPVPFCVIFKEPKVANLLLW